VKTKTRNQAIAGRDWRTFAACRGMNPELFYPTRGDMATVAAAKAVCERCPVARPCKEDGFREHLGIRAGLSEKQRRRLRRLRQAS
jgi:WhiB family redox-sensing transcriptional regulator